MIRSCSKLSPIVWLSYYTYRRPGCSKQLQGMRTTSFDASTKAISGSVPWMAPEVIKRSGYGRASDVWSAGATMIEMATASQPWPDLSNNFSAILLIATTNEPPPIPQNLSHRAQVFLRDCLQVEANERPTVSELLVRLFWFSIGSAHIFLGPCVRGIPVPCWCQSHAYYSSCPSSNTQHS